MFHKIKIAEKSFLCKFEIFKLLVVLTTAQSKEYGKRKTKTKKLGSLATLALSIHSSETRVVAYGMPCFYHAADINSISDQSNVDRCVDRAEP